jgi:hypothetical protein
MIGVKGGISGDADYFVDALRDVARRGATRVLISGTAEYAMLAILLHAYRVEGVQPRVTVTDICETPLAICRWYADRHDVAIQTQSCDILNERVDDEFDLIVTHAFLGWFCDADRRRIVAQWHAMLRSGGFVLTSQRIFSESPAGPWRSSPEDSEKATQKILAENRRQALHAILHLHECLPCRCALDGVKRALGLLDRFAALIARQCGVHLLDETRRQGVIEACRSDDQPARSQEFVERIRILDGAFNVKPEGLGTLRRDTVGAAECGHPFQRRVLRNRFGADLYDGSKLALPDAFTERSEFAREHIDLASQRGQPACPVALVTQDHIVRETHQVAATQCGGGKAAARDVTG